MSVCFYVCFVKLFLLKYNYTDTFELKLSFNFIDARSRQALEHEKVLFFSALSLSMTLQNLAFYYIGYNSSGAFWCDVNWKNSFG